MAVKIQVKDGFDTTCGLGVAPVTNAFQGVPSFNNTLFNNTMSCPTWGHRYAAACTPWNGRISPIGIDLQSNHLLAQASMRSSQLNEAIASVNLIDPMLAARIAGIGARCITTAIRIAQVASLDLELARQLVRMSAIDFQAVSTLSSLALVNPTAARMQLQQFGTNAGFNGQISTNALATVNDEGDVYRIEVRIPGATAESVDVTVRGGKLVIKADTNAMDVQGVQSVWVQEFVLGQDVSIDAIDATVSNGKLNVILPKTAAVRTMVGQRMQEVAVC